MTIGIDRGTRIGNLPCSELLHWEVTRRPATGTITHEDVVFVVSRHITQRSDPRERTVHFERLTPRQREVIIRKAEGKTYGQVAYELGVTEQTVKNHLGLVYARLGAEHLIEALRILGWLRVPGESQPARGHAA